MSSDRVALSASPIRWPKGSQTTIERKADMSATPIQLTTIGSRCTRIAAAPAALAAGGVQLELVHYPASVLEDRLTVTMTAEQAAALLGQIRGALACGHPAPRPAHAEPSTTTNAPA